MERGAAPVYGPLVEESNRVHGVFYTGQLELITDFIRCERGLLAKHTDRLHAMLAARGPTSEPAEPPGGGS